MPSGDSTTRRETLDLAIKVENHEKDLSGKNVTAYAFPIYNETPKIQIGQSAGTDVGTPFLIDVDLDFSPQEYDVELVVGDTILFPTEESELTIKVLDAKFNN